MYNISTREQSLYSFFISYSEEVGWHRERGKVGEEYGQGRLRGVGCQFLFTLLWLFLCCFGLLSKTHFLILLKGGRLNVMRLSLKIQEQLWYFKNTKNIYFHEILTVSLQT